MFVVFVEHAGQRDMVEKSDDIGRIISVARDIESFGYADADSVKVVRIKPSISGSAYYLQADNGNLVFCCSRMAGLPEDAWVDQWFNPDLEAQVDGSRAVAQ